MSNPFQPYLPGASAREWLKRIEQFSDDEVRSLCAGILSQLEGCHSGWLAEIESDVRDQQVHIEFAKDTRQAIEVYMLLVAFQHLLKTCADARGVNGVVGFLDGIREQSSLAGRHAADISHSKPGKSRDLHQQIRSVWATGKYSDREACAEQEWEHIGFGSQTTARKALRNTPDPHPWPARGRT
jgi:hypothetical protein